MQSHKRNHSAPLAVMLVILLSGAITINGCLTSQQGEPMLEAYPLATDDTQRANGKLRYRNLSMSTLEVSDVVPIHGQYWALIIGIDHYQHAPPLETAARDAQGVMDVLIDRYGFQKERVTLLLNERATRTNIEDALFRLSREAKSEDSVLIYYAGHGQYGDNQRLGWWVPVEGQPDRPGTFIMNSTIRDYMAGMQARHAYLVADSCFSGTLFSRTRAVMPPPSDNYFAQLYKKKSRWAFTSGGTEPVADEGQDGHSIFAYHFIKFLRENESRYLVPSHIADRVTPIVARNSGQLPRSQPLQGAGDEGGQFVFQLASVPAPRMTPGNGKAVREGQLINKLERTRAQLKQLQRDQVKKDEARINALKDLETQIEALKKQLGEAKEGQVVSPKSQYFDMPGGGGF